MEAFIWIFIIAIIIALVLYMRNLSRKITQADQRQSENLIILTDETFKKTIEKGVTLVDFWAPWCTPCKIQNPVINQIADELKGKAKVCKINVDKHKRSATQMQIRNIPNIIIFKNGKAEMQLIGVKPKHSIMKSVQSLLD